MTTPHEVIQVVLTDSSADMTGKQEAFARLVVETDNGAAAYRQVYDCAGSKIETIWREVARLRALPHVAKRIRELRDAAAAATLVRAIDLLRDDYDIATADPNELISAVIESCRNCHGADHKFHWIDEAEFTGAYGRYMIALERWQGLDPKLRAKVAEPQAPDMEGGYGFDPKVQPDLNCPHCFGKGVTQVIVRDTTRLSPAARKLYKGAKQSKTGEIEILMHDQAAARDRLYRALGAYKDGAQVPPIELPKNEAPISAEMSDEEATREYMKMVGR